MSTRSHTVALVVDPEFGEQLVALSHRVHVWVVDTPTNRAVAERIWRESGGYSRESGVTTFTALLTDSAEDIASSQLDSIELHHPGWSVLEVFGAHPGPILISALRELGLSDVRTTTTGFIASIPPKAAE